MTKFNDIVNKLSDVVSASDQKLVNELSELLERYNEDAPRSMNGLRTGAPALRNIMEMLIETTDSRI